MYHVIIFSRLSSSRLKKKALVQLSNKRRLIEQVIFQAKKLTSSNKIILATTLNYEDKKLCNIAQKNGIKFFRGSKDDLIKRAHDCCKKFRIKFFLRYCGDRPIVDVKKILDCFKKIKVKNQDFDLMTSNHSKIVDQGLTIEIFNSKALNQMNSLKLKKNDREHIGNYLYRTRRNHKIKKIRLNKNYFRGHKYTIDCKSDLTRVNFILNNYKNDDIHQLVKIYRNYEKFN